MVGKSQKNFTKWQEEGIKTVGDGKTQSFLVGAPDIGRKPMQRDMLAETMFKISDGK
jgi:hypothetical protein